MVLVGISRRGERWRQFAELMLDLGRRGDRRRQLAGLVLDLVFDLGRRSDRRRQLADLVLDRGAVQTSGRPGGRTSGAAALAGRRGDPMDCRSI